MFRNSNILIPTDFSHYALYAFRYGIAIAKEYSAHLHIVHILDPALFSTGSGHGYWITKTDLDKLDTSMTEHAEKRLAHLVEQARLAGVEATSYLERGKPETKIVELSQALKCDIITIATHGRTGLDRLIFGGVAERVVRYSEMPVLSIKHPEHEFVDNGDLAIHINRILFPTDFSDYAEKALPYAASLCAEFNAELVLMHVTEMPIVFPEYMPENMSAISEEMVSHAQEGLERIAQGIANVSTEILIRTGVAYREICRYVEENEVDLIVLPTHGKTGLAHLLFGSVADKVVRLARCPVLSIRPEALDRSDNATS